VIDGLILAAAEISRQLKQSAESSFPEPPVLAAR
jgi:hypothetical protein